MQTQRQVIQRVRWSVRSQRRTGSFKVIKSDPPSGSPPSEQHPPAVRPGRRSGGRRLPPEEGGGSLPLCSAPLWRRVGSLKLGAGRGVGGGHDLHVLSEDCLERLVSVDHGTEHKRLEETGSG